MELKPHKVQYWLHSSEKYESSETYAEKVNEICDLYQHAQELEDNGTHVVSTDEMTGIQALEHKYPDKLPVPGQCAKQEFEYIRHGTISLIGFFHVANGSLYDPYLNKTRTENDMCQAVARVVDTDPAANWIFICDGLNTHKSETLVRLVAERCAITADLGLKGKSGILKTRHCKLNDAPDKAGGFFWQLKVALRLKPVSYRLKVSSG